MPLQNTFYSLFSSTHSDISSIDYVEQVQISANNLKISLVVVSTIPQDTVICYLSILS